MQSLDEYRENVLFGYRQAKYFPILLSIAFVVSSLYGEQAVTKE